MPGRGSLTVVIPTHQRPVGLAAALASLHAARQPPGGLRVIVVADGEQAHVVPIVASARQEGLDVELICQEHRGPSAARNRGALTVRDGGIAFIDDDCRASAGWAETMAAALVRHPNAVLGGPISNGCAGMLGSDVNHLVHQTVCRWFAANDPAQAFFPSMNMAMSAETFRDLGGFDERLPHSHDRDICERATRSGRRLFEAPGALVVHDRRLGLAGLWRQHHGFGRGGALLRATREDRGQPSSGPQPGLYAALARAALRERRPALSLFGVALAQVALCSGMASELIRLRAARFGSPSNKA
jgi:GT2 family glycosyltransferase